MNKASLSNAGHTSRPVVIRRKAKLISAVLFSAALIGSLVTASAPGVAADSDETIAVSLATMLRASRAVISKNQKHINDANIGDKGLSTAVVVAKAKENYKKATGTDVDSIDPASLHGKLIKAQLAAIAKVMDNAQGTINKKGVSLKGFLPAVFARLVAEGFTANVSGQATLKLTAPKSYVRNRSNRPDAWENNVIESMFKSADHPKNKHVAEAANVKGKKAFRVILPEYYGKSCLSCHGGPKGERDITGGKKEGGTLGELGGAISVAIFK
ncbi:MAG: DUF3365 domain-containing protein [Alphaproteobacteria bacterium]|nr:DUF3365 domain-containing protein [Alphaproteobacteria bacterium]